MVTVVLALLLIAAVPNLQRTAQRMRVEHVAVALTQLLRAAHEQAVSSAQCVVWIWDEGAQRARIEPETAEGAKTASPPPQVPSAMKSVSVPDGFSIALTRNGARVECGCIRFFPDGTSEPAALSVRFREHALTASVDETTSRVRLAAGTAAR
ncbi:MAG: hypothetical protein HYZ91_02680 [Candidatus Omnitrophica bacterium]|nr:hypothetical protein [Candidatus Omnitrophota bacterium]